jgi:hypothetical protein
MVKLKVHFPIFVLARFIVDQGNTPTRPLPLVFYKLQG